MAPLHCSLGRKLKFEWEYEALYVNAKALLLVTEDWYFASHRLLRADRIREKWQEHLSGDHNWQYLLWDVLVFQGWFLQSKSAGRVPVLSCAKEETMAKAECQ